MRIRLSYELFLISISNSCATPKSSPEDLVQPLSVLTGWYGELGSHISQLVRLQITGVQQYIYIYIYQGGTSNKEARNPTNLSNQCNVSDSLIKFNIMKHWLKTFFFLSVDQDSVLRADESSSPCDVKYTKVGCYQDNMSARTLENLLFQDRNIHGNKFSGKLIDWNNWGNYTQE